MIMTTAMVNEIFYSWQGEGPYCGVPQVLVRFNGCNISCAYCDTDCFSPQVYQQDELLKQIQQTARGRYCHSISITGGEPLLQADFLGGFLPRLKQNDYRIYLETNGILVSELRQIKKYVDFIAMDMKLPGSTQLGGFWKEHELFLAAARDKDIFVKAVITDKTRQEDIETAVEIICRVDASMALVLQPVTPVAGCHCPSPAQIGLFKKIALQKLKKVSIIPQLHVLAGVR